MNEISPPTHRRSILKFWLLKSTISASMWQLLPMNSPWWKKAFAFARCGRKQSGNIKTAMIPVKYRGKKTSVCLQACLKAIMIIFCNWDLWILPSSHFRFWFTLTMKQKGFIWTRHHKSQGCVMMFELRHRWRYYMWKVLRMLLSIPRERQSKARLSKIRNFAKKTMSLKWKKSDTLVLLLFFTLRCLCTSYRSFDKMFNFFF